MQSILDSIHENPTLLFKWIVKILFVFVALAMSISKKIINKIPNKNTDFEAAEGYNGFVIENQYGRYKAETENDFCGIVENMLNDENQFATLTAPESINSVKYVQACLSNGKVEVQIGLDFYNKTELYYKICNDNEVLDIFKDFYNEKFIPDLSEYRPVSFIE